MVRLVPGARPGSDDGVGVSSVWWGRPHCNARADEHPNSSADAHGDAGTWRTDADARTGHSDAPSDSDARSDSDASV